MTTTHFITSGKATLSAEAVGGGDPVIFLHAGVADSRMWRAQMQVVGATHRAISYDRRGFGATRAQREDYSAVADLEAVADALGGGAPAILVGCSQGGRVAIDAALAHPSRARGLVLIAPAVSGAPDATSEARSR
jgi:pimeloyl-ACP methyl ester carboxylesterase